MLALHLVASAYGQRPSEIAGVDALGDWAAFQFDLLVLKRALDDRRQPGRPLRRAGGFADPSGMVSAVVRVNPDGTW